MQKILSQRLREGRKRDLTEKAYQNYELGTHEPKLSIIMRIAEFYNVSIDYLVGLTDDPSHKQRKQ